MWEPLICYIWRGIRCKATAISIEHQDVTLERLTLYPVLRRNIFITPLNQELQISKKVVSSLHDDKQPTGWDGNQVKAFRSLLNVFSFSSKPLFSKFNENHSKSLQPGHKIGLICGLSRFSVEPRFFICAVNVSGFPLQMRHHYLEVNSDLSVTYSTCHNSLFPPDKYLETLRLLHCTLFDDIQIL